MTIWSVWKSMAWLMHGGQIEGGDGIAAIGGGSRRMSGAAAQLQDTLAARPSQALDRGGAEKVFFTLKKSKWFVQCKPTTERGFLRKWVDPYIAYML